MTGPECDARPDVDPITVEVIGITPGAGSYGDPRERDRALVRRDLAEGVISETVARDAYGLTERA
jgi:N-methylhydantoinase B/oxoprolinase/acetone carboxylase alpha subunit